MWNIPLGGSVFDVRANQQAAPLTLDDLPPPNLKRWITRRKAAVVGAVRAGLIGLDEARTRYGITIEEFLSWQRRLDEHGLCGLRATRLQDYRRLAQGEGVAGAQPAGGDG
ncbi:MAG: DUF1153 domain-containing protein [Proteobacteria bacterium]|nr:DUF1153 domain-containing protein [Pseudomonadota bacterium]